LPERGVAVPLPATFEVEDPVLAGIRVTGRLGADPDSATVTIDELRFHRQEGGPSIDPQHLRRVSVPRILATAVAVLGVPWDATSGVINLQAATLLTRGELASATGKPARGKPTGDELQRVADVYNENPGYRPTARVAEMHGWSRSKAARRVAAAREAGLIKDATK
jgi:hypothetical protein